MTILLLCCAPAVAGGNGSVASVDAYARASGNDKATAVQIGKRLFATQWNAQILKVYVNRVQSHAVAGLSISGVKFHHPMNRAQFMDEVSSLVTQSLTASDVEEVDVWAQVPLSVGKGVVVSGDLAKPTQRTVFTVTVRRGESAAVLRSRIASSRGVYWDSAWVAQALGRGCSGASGKCQSRNVP